jgi:sugar/nucleoside kinase (ribokinase family)
MKLLIVGHFCLDVIHPAEGPEVQSYGGIYYTLATLAALAGTNDTIIPVFGVGRNDYPPLIEHLSRFTNVDTSGIFSFDGPTNTVHLYYKNKGTRVECSKNIARPISFERIRRYLSADGVLINMVSGFDLTLETVDQIRLAIRSHDVVLHLDYHSLTLGIGGSFERFRRPLPDWRRWAFMVDTVQLNEEEIGGLTLEHQSEPETAGHLLTLSVKGVVVTRGDQGATVYYNDHKRLERKDIPGIHVDEVRDATGCGDVFGAAFHHSYVKTRDMMASAQAANRIAAAKVQMSGSGELRRLKSLSV